MKTEDIKKKKRNRLYKIHHNLRKRDNKIITRQRFVVKREINISEIEQKWLSELISAGYCVCNDLFSNEYD